MRKSKILAIALIALFISSSLFVFVPTPVRAAGVTIAFDYTHTQVGNQTIYRDYGLPGPSFEQVDRARLTGNLTKAGYTLSFINATTGITSSALQNVNVLFLGKVSNPSLNYSSSEISAIKSWFATGSKLLMVSGDSDFTTNDTQDTSWHESIPNHVLAAVGSQLRLEYGEVTDQPGVGASGAGFRVYASSANGGVNYQGFANNLTMNTQKVRFHGTTGIIGYSGGNYVNFSALTSNTVTWLYRTSPQGTVQLFGSAKPLVYKAATPGQYVLAAAEKIPEGSTYSKVVLAGAGFYGNYVINGDTEFSYNIVFQGLTFVMNSVKWGTTAESLPSTSYNWTFIAEIAAVVIVVLAAAALYLMRRKPKAAAPMPS